MLTWREFTAARADLEAHGREMLYQHGLGLGFLATVTRDGGPRVHPVCPILTPHGLYVFVVPGPKLDDLRRNGRYALHCETFAPPRHDDAFYVTGTPRELDDHELREALTQQLLRERDLAEPWPGFQDEPLVELLVGTCLLTLTAGTSELPAGHTVWRANAHGPAQ